jgi:hypothetical protein
MRVRLAVLVALAGLAGAGPAAGATSLTIGAPQFVSGASPFASCTVGGGGVSGNSTVAVNSEVEPFVAAHGSNVIGVYQQDRWNDGGAHGLVSSRSANSGGSWTFPTFAQFSECAGGPAPWERSSDPWITFDKAGNAYWISLSVSANEVNSSIQVSKSTDNGATWSIPTVIQQDASNITFNDKESITGDPARGDTVYAVWDRSSFPSDSLSLTAAVRSAAFRAVPTFSRTTDGGKTWSTPVSLTNANLFTIGNQVAVLPSGRLVDIFFASRGSGRQPSANQLFEGVMLSDDAGAHWTQPIKIANYTPAPLADPDNGNPIRAGTNIPDIAVDPTNGDLYAVWADGSASGGVRNSVVLAKSTDGGRNWTVLSQQLNPEASADAFNPAVEVTSGGDVVVTYYDDRNNTSATGLPTDVWITNSDDGGATWSEQHLYGSFDMEQAPDAGGYFLGDYQGLTPLGTGVLALFAVTGGPSGPSDIVAETASP